MSGISSLFAFKNDEEKERYIEWVKEDQKRQFQSWPRKIIIVAWLLANIAIFIFLICFALFKSH